MNHTGYIVSEGFPFIAILGAGTFIAFLAGLPWIALVLLALTLFVTWFFRNPERRPPENPRQLASPADGKVIGVEEVTGDGRPGRPLVKVSIFMNVFNVHVNRVPYSGEVSSIGYKPGKFLSANLDKASLLNERNTVVIRTEEGQEITVVQIAGLIARRIVCWVNEGMKVRRGERFGLIRFGSRVELFLPAGSTLLVKKGDTVRAGETPIGELP
ncbi:MAG: phosphatidylserine decarboxylase family protein [Syntrophales bacterium]